jgi:hypothetical protein
MRPSRFLARRECGHGGVELGFGVWRDDDGNADRPEGSGGNLHKWLPRVRTGRC